MRQKPEMRRYQFLISASYPYPLKTIRIHGSTGTITPRVKKISSNIFDCSFNIGCQILIVFKNKVKA